MATTQSVANAIVGGITTPTAPTAVKDEGNKGLVYVTIPDRNVLGWDHPGIGINLKHYGPGTHAVSEDLAKEINERLKVYHQGMLELLQPQVNRLVREKLASSIG